MNGITINKKLYKFYLFAGDLLLYLSNINNSILYVVKIMTEFSRLSDCKMNVEITELMVIDKSINNLETFKQFKVQTKSIKYLSCYISSDKLELYKENCLPLIKDFKQDTGRWSDLKINLIDRINIFMITWLPKYLYIFLNILITPPKAFFKEVNSLLSSFI